MNSLRIFIAVLLTVVTLSHSTPSEAVVGKITHRQKVVTAGLVMIGTGGAIAVGGVALVNASCEGLGCLGVLIPMMVGGIVAGVGLITLEGEQVLEFQPISAEIASKLGISRSDREIFNDEVDQANMLMKDVSSALSEKASVEESVTIWEEMKSFVSPATFSVMQKIVTQK